ncbi:uncharacterized protein F4822DRAFT_418507 [Hypoxylon trugodes]|uniref:uncharacterized protein n=1 Tax=Hypoxylon trugodes TaxID=326681 RepID=UPI002197C146|nr:uncharacterized protein F4822DRAFT_418507 [Hypoxylon trugodes]KAI1384060.1 hypothetical protein F4822DRAFT_418507 [Hypoxylon trugodes]
MGWLSHGLGIPSGWFMYPWLCRCWFCCQVGAIGDMELKCRGGSPTGADKTGRWGWRWRWRGMGVGVDCGPLPPARVARVGVWFLARWRGFGDRRFWLSPPKIGACGCAGVGDGALFSGLPGLDGEYRDPAGTGDAYRPGAIGRG